MQKQKGFTLIELAIVMIIIGLLIGAGVSLLPGLINQQKYTQNQSLLNQNYNAINGYIILQMGSYHLQVIQQMAHSNHKILAICLIQPLVA